MIYGRIELMGNAMLNGFFVLISDRSLYELIRFFMKFHNT